MRKLKFLFFLIIILLYVSIDVSSVLASDSYVVSLPELPDEPSGFEYYYIKKTSAAEYNLYWLETTDVYISNNNYYFAGKWWGWSYRVTEDINNHVWANRWGWYNGASDHTLIMPVNGTLNDCNIVYSNFDIKYNDELLRSKLELNTEPIEPDDTPTLSGIGGFFTDLKNSLLQFFTDLGSKISNLANTVTNLFTNLFDKLSELFSNVLSAIANIPDLIISGIQGILEFLFVPSDNLFIYAQELFEEKFAIFYQVKNFLVDLTKINVSNDLPVFNINYKGVEASIIDFSMYQDYRSFVHGIIIAISYFFFGKWLLNNVPTILGGIYSSTS